VRATTTTKKKKQHQKKKKNSQQSRGKRSKALPMTGAIPHSFLDKERTVERLCVDLVVQTAYTMQLFVVCVRVCVLMMFGVQCQIARQTKTKTEREKRNEE
jgi:hypothetical protein